jgi:hypothetical protein
VRPPASGGRRRGQADGVAEVAEGPGGDLVLPRLVGLFGDVYDEVGTNVAWGVVCWALRFPGGGALTFTEASATSARLWLSLADAVASLDNAWVAPLEPKPLSRWRRQPR